MAGCSTQYLGKYHCFYALWFIFANLFKKMQKCVDDGAVQSLLVELLQLVFKVGSFDVDDLLLNTIGGLLGYLVYKGLIDLWKRYEKVKNNVNK